MATAQEVDDLKALLAKLMQRQEVLEQRQAQVAERRKNSANFDDICAVFLARCRASTDSDPVQAGAQDMQQTSSK